MNTDHITEKNRKVFSTFPDTPYLGEIRPRKKRMKALTLMTRAAAVLFIPLAIYTVIDLMSDSKGPEIQDDIAMTERLYRVDNGVKGKVTLPDGTTVQLNSGSELLLSDNFSSERFVSLKGEGYFEVKADTSNPFYIKTPKDVTIKVTGTTFNLCCYQEEQEVKLSLIKGSVEVMKDSRTLYRMTEQEEVSILGEEIITVTEVPEESTAWTKGSLMFEDTSMKEVISRMERWYGKKIIVEDPSIYESSFTGDFRSESIGQVLELLRITSGINYTVEEDKITLSKE